MATPYAVRAYEALLARNRYTWRSTLAHAVLGPLLSLLAMGLGVGELVARRSPPGLAGVRYASFLAPGLLAAAAMQTAVSESSWPVLAAVKSDRRYHAALASPLSPAHLLHGHVLWTATRLVVATTAFVAVALLVGLEPSWRTPLLVPAAVLTGLAFTTPVAAWSVGRRSEASLPVLHRIVVMPLFLFSATFFPLTSLPLVLKLVVQALPLWHGVALCRGLAVGGLDATAAAGHVAYLVAVVVAGLVAGRRTFAKALSS